MKVFVVKAYNAANKTVNKVTTINQQVIFGREGNRTVQPIDFNNEVERNRFVTNINTFTKDPSLVNALSVLQILNSYDLCNPFMFITSNLFPPGSQVANTFNAAQSKINEIVSTFENFSIVDGIREVSATARNSISNISDAELVFGGNSELVGIPFQTGKIFLNIKSTDKISKGSLVTITQTNDNKITSRMTGQVELSTPSSNNTQTLTINVNSIYPYDPPTESDGTTKKLFTQFLVEYETKTSSDVRELGENLIELSDSLRNIGLVDLATELNALPDFIPGVSTLKDAIVNVVTIIEEISNQAIATDQQNITGTAGQFLVGNLTTAQVISRVRVLRDFYSKIRPYTNLNFTIQTFFEDEIAGINRFLRNVIPYRALSLLVSIVNSLSTGALGTVNFVIGLLKALSSTLKTINTVLKTIRFVLKAARLAIKAVPSLFTTVGIIETTTNVIGDMLRAVQYGIDFITILQNASDALLRQLQLTKYYLELLLREGAKLQASLESCTGLNNSSLGFSINQANRNNFVALQNLLSTIPQLNLNLRVDNSDLANGAGTFVTLEDGSILILPDSVFGYDESGNIVFYGESSESLSTGVNFNNTLGQEFRSKLQYYTFNKFKNPEKLNRVRNSIEQAEALYLQNQARRGGLNQTTIADPEDRFGNFQELYLGYTLKIQEERRVDQNSNILLRRRGIALDSNSKIVASTELTFSTDLATIVQEIKIKINQFVQQGIIGTNTMDPDSNQVSDDDALNLAASYNANTLGLNNLKATENDKALSDVINPGSNLSTNNTQGDIITSTDTPGVLGVSNTIASNNTVETRIGNEPFSSPDSNNRVTTVQNTPVNTPNNTPMQVTGNKAPAINKKIDLQKITDKSLNDFITSNASLKGIQDSLSTISSLSPTQLSKMLSGPGSENLNEEELIAKLKANIFSELNPNPDKVNEVRSKVDTFTDALRNVIRAEWEAATRYVDEEYKVPFEVYYNEVEDDKIKDFIQQLNRSQLYTEEEISLGITRTEIQDKYQIIIDGSKVSVRPRSGK